MRRYRLAFSPIEITDLVKAWVATSVAFGVFFMHGQLGDASFLSFVVICVIAGATAGVGFLAHELMHKVAASRFGVHSEFRSNDAMLVLSILIAFFGFIFAAPGAVQLHSNVTRKESGIISLAGPAANMVLALAFLPVALFGGAFAPIGIYGMFVNALLGAFNLIPFFGFDGQKVFDWHKGWYVTAVVVAGMLVMASFSVVGV
jgi:Zn-dependent protease